MDDRVSAAGARVNGQVEELMRRMNAKAVFGEPIEKGDVTLIPVATVMYGFGTGQGWGRSPKEGAPEGVSSGGEAAVEGAEAQQNEGAGAGGGGGGVARPIGYIRIDAEGAHWEPTMDMTRVSIGGMMLAGWIVYQVMRVARAGIRLEAMRSKRKNCC